MTCMRSKCSKQRIHNYSVKPQSPNGFKLIVSIWMCVRTPVCVCGEQFYRCAEIPRHRHELISPDYSFASRLCEKSIFRLMQSGCIETAARQSSMRMNEWCQICVVLMMMMIGKMYLTDKLTKDPWLPPYILWIRLHQTRTRATCTWEREREGGCEMYTTSSAPPSTQSTNVYV